MTVNYQPLESFLRATPLIVQEVTLSFEQIELVIGDHLPDSHLSHRQWWENQSAVSSRAQARAWTNAGFMVEAVNQVAPGG
jgi:hypothetical protein